MHVPWGGAGGESPCRTAADVAADNDDDDGHIGDVRVDGIVEDGGDDDNLDNDNDNKGKHENGEDDNDDVVVSG